MKLKSNHGRSCALESQVATKDTEIAASVAQVDHREGHSSQRKRKRR